MLMYFIFFVAFIGCVLGSFLKCMAWRISHQESFVKGRSHCPKCGHTLGALDLIPVFSWLLLVGKCRYCKASISARYPLTELFMASMSVLCFARYNFSLVMIRNYVLLCCLFTLSLIDMEVFEIPDGCILIPIFSWFLFTYFIKENIVIHLLAAFFYSGCVLITSFIMDKISGKENIGGGDIKLLFVMGLYLGIIGGMIGLFLSCIIGIFFALFAKKDENKHFPFGPALSIAFYLVLLYGQPMINGYMNVLDLLSSI